MSKIPLLLITSLLFVTPDAKAEKKEKKTSRNTTISVMKNYSFGGYYFGEKNGLISTENADTKLAFSIHKDYYFHFLPHSTFLSFGVRYKGNSARVLTHTHLQGFSNDSYNEVALYYDNLSVPIHVGRTFNFRLGGRLDVFGGIALGISNIAKGSNSVGFRGSSLQNGDYVTMPFPDFLDIGSYKFYSSLDAGFRIAPFKFRNLSFGLTVAIDLTKTVPLSNRGSFINLTAQTEDKYSYSFSRRFTNIMFGVNYTFGRNWK